jgi:fimbrial chaperone protein
MLALYRSALQPSRFRRLLHGALGLFLALGTAGASWAGSFQVNPIRIDLSGAKRVAVERVSNTGTEPVVVQLSVMSWTQNQGEDVLAPTREILISPPIATIAPSKEQIVRVGLRRAPDPQRELSYRLLVQEVPPPPKPGFQGLQIALRISLPIFVQPRQGKAKPALVWSARPTGPDSVRLSLENRGTGHIQFSALALYETGQKEPVAEQRGLAYVLAGQSRHWDLTLKKPLHDNNERLHLQATTDAGRIETEIEVAAH